MLNVNKLECKDKITPFNNININDIYYRFIEIPAKLFKSKKYELIYVYKKDIENVLNIFIENLSKSLNLNIKVCINYENEFYNVILDSNENSILIGKDGKMLNSIQLIIHQMISNLTDFNIRVNVDVADYKIKKQKRIENEIKKIAKEVINSKIEAKLDPMNSYDRRIVHTIISDYEELETESFGENPNRYVVIRYKEEK